MEPAQVEKREQETKQLNKDAVPKKTKGGLPPGVLKKNAKGTYLDLEASGKLIHDSAPFFHVFFKGNSFYDERKGGAYLEKRGYGIGYHEGCDFITKGKKAEVYVSMDVTVVKCGHGQSSGNFITVSIPMKDGPPLYISFMHLNKRPKFKSGEVIPAESVIGATGKTGRTSGSSNHLHIECYYEKDGKRTYLHPLALFGFGQDMLDAVPFKQDSKKYIAPEK
ncbi:MAG: M23 family metallopeptidase [Candidatus Bilamarchaeaceae archaeon]